MIVCRFKQVTFWLSLHVRNILCADAQTELMCGIVINTGALLKEGSLQVLHALNVYNLEPIYCLRM
jgi:hypothetical protein